MKLFNDLYKYREFLKSNIKKDIRGKYKGSFLGILWSFLNPLLAVLVYAIVFPYIMRVKVDNYLIYLITGVLPWTFFTTSINMGLNSILFNANIIKKVYFPRIILPVSSATSALVNFLISCIIILIFVIFSGIGLTWNLLWLPLIIIIQYLLILGIVFVLSALEIYIRDIEHIITFLISMIFYVTPILYTPDFVPTNLKWILQINPMSYIIMSYRDVFCYGKMPELGGILIVFFISIIILIIGYHIFEKLQRGFAEEV